MRLAYILKKHNTFVLTRGSVYVITNNLPALRHDFIKNPQYYHKGVAFEEFLEDDYNEIGGYYFLNYFVQNYDTVNFDNKNDALEIMKIKYPELLC